MTSDLRKSWELGGIGDEVPSETHRLPLPARVELSSSDKNKLIWVHLERRKARRLEPRKAATRVSSPPDLLLKFAELADASPQAICDFARAWGVLCLCRHGLPATHSLLPGDWLYFSLASPKTDDDLAKLRQGRAEFDDGYCRPLGIGHGVSLFYDEGCEYICDWRFFSRMARALLNVITKLNQDELGSQNDWKAILERATINWDYPQSVAEQRMECTHVVNAWVRLATLRPQLFYEGDPKLKEGYSVQLVGENYAAIGSPLFACLASQMMSVLLGRGIALCSGCGKIYSPRRRKPKRGQNNYCPDCGRTVALRHAQEKFRMKQKSRGKVKDKEGSRRRERRATKKGK